MSLPTFSVQIYYGTIILESEASPSHFSISIPKEGMELSGCTDNYGTDGRYMDWKRQTEEEVGTERSSEG
jgi:hypothetical protein